MVLNLVNTYVLNKHKKLFSTSIGKNKFIRQLPLINVHQSRTITISNGHRNKISTEKQLNVFLFLFTPNHIA